jgi:hypothetical protein
MLKRYLFIPAIWIVVLDFWSLPALAEIIVDTAWVRRYNGTGNDADRGEAIAVDGSRNVYVTGYSTGSGTGFDYATVKYLPNGDSGWVRRYNGSGDSIDIGLAIAVDNSGNAHVTGYSVGSGTGRDYATIKYYPDGDAAWVRRYNGPGNGYDGAWAIAVDDSGNVYVTGCSVGSGTGFDYATVKYDPNGEELWVTRYNGAGNKTDVTSAIAVDDLGNVYVTGWSWGSGTEHDYVTIKHYPDGDTAWVRRYDGPAGLTDQANDIAIDGSGNVCVTGLSDGGGTSYDYATIKYDRFGNEAWVRRYNGPGNSFDRAWAIAVDGSNNVHVTGNAWSDETYWDYATIKYDLNGTQLWVSTYSTPGSGGDFAYDIALDDVNNVYVTGHGHADYATVKYDQNGNEHWVVRYNGPSDSADYAQALAVDDSGYAYVTGQSGGIGTGADYATIKYVQSGYLRGDANGDGVIDIADVVYLINYLFIDGLVPDPLWLGDANCDGVVDIGDVVYLLNYLFLGGPAPGC